MAESGIDNARYLLWLAYGAMKDTPHQTLAAEYLKLLKATDAIIECDKKGGEE